VYTPTTWCPDASNKALYYDKSTCDTEDILFVHSKSSLMIRTDTYYCHLVPLPNTFTANIRDPYR